VVDTLVLARRKHPGGLTLEDLCSRYGVNSLRSKHYALLDAELLAAANVELTTTRQAALQLEIAVASSQPNGRSALGEALALRQEGANLPRFLCPLRPEILLIGGCDFFPRLVVLLIRGAHFSLGFALAVFATERRFFGTSPILIPCSSRAARSSVIFDDPLNQFVQMHKFR
jgi:hypothetical protein